MSLHFILDGYNLVKQDAHLAVLKLEAGRNALLKEISGRRLQGSENNAVTVVFDGQIHGSLERYQSGIDVVFTGGESADDWIKHYVESSKTSKTIVVVTDDREIRHFVRALGATIMATREFLEGRGSRRRIVDGAARKKRQSLRDDHRESLGGDKKEISSVLEHKITSELSKVWLKGKG